MSSGWLISPEHIIKNSRILWINELSKIKKLSLSILRNYSVNLLFESIGLFLSVRIISHTNEKKEVVCFHFEQIRMKSNVHIGQIRIMAASVYDILFESDMCSAFFEFLFVPNFFKFIFKIIFIQLNFFR
jgi:hypothetical protein